MRDAQGGRKAGQGRSLDVTQELLVRQLIADKTPDQLKMPYALWTRAAVGQLIEQCFGIRLAVRTVGLYLSRWGFTPQKPMRKAYEQSPAAVKNGSNMTTLSLPPEPRPRAPRFTGGREWAAQRRRARAQLRPKGQTPVVRVSNKRHGLSVISTVTNKGEMRWKIFDGALNADILIDFMQRLIRGAKKKIFLVLDNLRVHHAKPVKAWLAANKERIEVFYLPSYSPELNPDEMLNADLKQAVTKLAPARTKLQLVKATSSHLRSVQRQPARVRKYFENEPIRYAA
ncbi:IS630 family transposase [Ralstonia syzygii subsp. celebesensis]